MSKKVEFQDHQFVVVATMRVSSDLLRYAPEGGLVEDPQLLDRVTELIAAASQVDGATFQFAETRGMVGAYVVDILAVDSLVDCKSEINALLDGFEECKVRLDTNMASGKARTATECGVSAAVLDVLKITSGLKAQKHPIEIVTPDGDPREVAAPDPLAIVALAPENQKKAKKVDGEVQGIGRGDDRGCIVRLGKGTEFMVSCLTLEEAWEALRSRCHIKGIARWDKDAYLLEEGAYSICNQLEIE